MKILQRNNHLIALTYIGLVQCLPSFYKTRDKIIGGHEAKRYQFPHMVAIIYGSMFLCGGSIISSKWIVSAAHCFVRRKNASFIKVVAGKLILGENHPDVQTGYVLRLITHPYFKYTERMRQSTNDIALLQLKDALHFSNAVRPIRLPYHDQKFVGDVVLTGWGYVKWKPKPIAADVLQVLHMPLISKEECKRILDLYPIKLHVLRRSEICTLPYRLDENGCIGDSGSPLIQDRILVGITSWGDDNCGVNLTRKAPNVFTEVSKYIKFIQNHTQRRLPNNDYCK